MCLSVDIDINNISKIEPLSIALKNDSLNSNLDSIYLITLVLNNHYDIITSDLRVFYKLMLKEAVNKDTTLFDVFINILYDYYKNDIEKDL